MPTLPASGSGGGDGRGSRRARRPPPAKMRVEVAAEVPLRRRFDEPLGSPDFPPYQLLTSASS